MFRNGDIDLKKYIANSETFFAPAFTKYKNGDDDFLQKQDMDREKQVCAIGPIDMHLQLKISNKCNDHDNTMSFNPRIHSPCAGYPWTGRFVPENTHKKYMDDPIQLGREIQKTSPYDERLYKTIDPRLRSKTLVIRDFGCKIPVDINNSDREIAHAVLSHYPDQLKEQLQSFVSNVFGKNMRSFLQSQIEGYQKMLDNPDELNRVSWAAYMSVQGGIDPNARDRHPHDPFGNDVTLTWKKEMSEMLSKFTTDGRAMTGYCSSEDVYDLRPCIRQHITTLKMMKDDFCKGFASSEVNVVAMLTYANEQGRKMITDCP